MSELTQGQLDHLTSLEAQMNANFTEPKYIQNYRLIYTTDPSKADLTISKHHTILDYLAIGFVALAKQPDSDTPVIMAMHKNYPEEPSCHAYIGNSQAKPLPHTALMDVWQQIDATVQKHLHYPGFMPFGIGLGLMTYLPVLHMGYVENPDIQLDFQDFNDVLAAQMLAFSNLKKYTVSAYLGSVEAAMTGND